MLLYSQTFFPKVLIKPKPVNFQTTVVSEQARQLVSETLQHVSRIAEVAPASAQEGALKEEPQAYAESSSPSADLSHGSHGKSDTFGVPLISGVRMEAPCSKLLTCGAL